AKKSAPAKAAQPAAASKAVKAGKAEAEDKKKAAAKPAAAKPAAEAKGKPGRKPKAGAVAAKKEEVPEEDFSDLEADLEGEPEVEVEAAGTDDKAVKAKPLRMK